MKLKVGVLGPGAIGGFLAGLFWKHGHEVLCIGKNETVLAIRNNGIRIESPIFGDFVAQPGADVTLAVPVDVLFITTKSSYLNDALARVDARQVETAVVVSLLNGLGHQGVIRARLGDRLTVGTIGLIEVAKGNDGVIRQLSRQNPHIDLASDTDIPRAALEQIAEAIRNSGISALILDSEAEVVWRKLVRLGAIASLTAAFQKPVGSIRSDPESREFLEAIVREGALVALHEGVRIDPDEVLKQIDALPDTLTTSLQRDDRSHAASELEAITGGVLRLAKRYDISVPAYERAYGLICRQSR